MVMEDTEFFTNLRHNKEEQPLQPMENCFICNQKVGADKLMLSKLTTTHTGVGLPEKISHLIGEEFVVIVTEQDVICKRCCSLLNHMDKLENEACFVKKALISYIKEKYDLPVEEPNMGPNSKDVQKEFGTQEEDAVDDDEEEDRNSNSAGESMENDVLEQGKDKAAIKRNLTPLSRISSNFISSPMSNSYSIANSLNRKRPATNNKLKEPLSKMKTPDSTTPKMKIYRCGFCSFQSKDLNNVRSHMKIHVKPTKRDDDQPILPKPLPPSSPATNAVTNMNTAQVKRRLFRCQVCSASFDERAKCVEHISLEHTSAGKKKLAQAPTGGGVANPLSNTGSQLDAPTVTATDTLSANVSADNSTMIPDINTSQMGEYAGQMIQSNQTQFPSMEQAVPQFDSAASEFFNSEDQLATTQPLLLGTDPAELQQMFGDTSHKMKTEQGDTVDHPLHIPEAAHSVTSAVPKDEISGGSQDVNDILNQFAKTAAETDLDTSGSDHLVANEADSMTSTASLSEQEEFSGVKNEDDSRSSDQFEQEGKRKVHSIDIEAMIAALHNEGPNTTL